MGKFEGYNDTMFTVSVEKVCTRKNQTANDDHQNLLLI